MLRGLPYAGSPFVGALAAANQSNSAPAFRAPADGTAPPADHTGAMTQIVTTHESALKSGALSTGRFVLHFAEMWLAMLAGMFVFHAFVHGSMTDTLYQVGMAASMTLPMVAWMRVRGHSLRHGIEMALGMLLPWAAVSLLASTEAVTVLPWLAEADGAAMLLGMVAVMLLRPHHYS
jgi:flagellar biosynthetic protein FliP